MLARADQLFDLDGDVMEIPLRQVVEVMVPLPGVQEIAGDHRVEGRSGQFDAGVAEHDAIVFQVLAELADRRVFQHRPQGVERRLGIEQPRALRPAERKVIGLLLVPGERNAHDLGPPRPDMRRLRIDRNLLLPPHFGHQGCKGLGRVDRRVDRLVVPGTRRVPSDVGTRSAAGSPAAARQGGGSRIPRTVRGPGR